jgi:hypothetical protein
MAAPAAGLQAALAPPADHRAATRPRVSSTRQSHRGSYSPSPAGRPAPYPAQRRVRLRQPPPAFRSRSPPSSPCSLMPLLCPTSSPPPRKLHQHHGRPTPRNNRPGPAHLRLPPPRLTQPPRARTPPPARLAPAPRARISSATTWPHRPQRPAIPRIRS